MISRIGVFGVQSPLHVQLSIPDFAMGKDRWFTIFLDPTVQMMSRLHKSRISPWRSRGLNLVHLLADPTVVGPFARDLTAEILLPFSRSPRLFWTGFPLWIYSQDESYGCDDCSLHTETRSLLLLQGFSSAEEKFVNLSKIWKNFMSSLFSAPIFDSFKRILVNL